jgi:hypothetical protein
MITATERVNSVQLYKDNYYASEIVIFCKFCNITVDHTNKSKVDQHLKTKKHENNKTTIERRTNNRPQQQITLETFEYTISEKDELNWNWLKSLLHLIFL